MWEELTILIKWAIKMAFKLRQTAEWGTIPLYSKCWAATCIYEVHMMATWNNGNNIGCTRPPSKR